MPRKRRGLLLGIDIGGTSLRLALADAPGRILGQRKIPSPAGESPEAMVKAICQCAEDLLAGVEGGTVGAVGLAAPGPVDVSLGQIMDAPNLPQFKSVPLRDMLQGEMGRPVTMENDANAAALAEHRLGCGQGVQDMLYITVSTGIGGGIIARGEVYHGARGAAGEIGHMTIQADGPSCGCGRNGCWESLASGTAIAREASHRIEAGEDTLLSDVIKNGSGRLDAQAVHQAALKGDRTSQEILQRASFYLGVGLANVVNIFNPELIVLGGGLTQMGDQFLAPAFQVCRERAFPLHVSSLRLEVTRLGDEIALLGALVLAQELRDGGVA
ncbi:MAG: ROK family protein [Dehalococcoidia bacterium]